MEEIIKIISSKVDDEHNKYSLIIFIEVIEELENSDQILSFITKNIDVIKWNRLLNSFTKIENELSTILFKSNNP